MIILSSLICAYKIEQKQDDESINNSTSIIETADTADIPQWKIAYLDFLEKEKETHRSYALVYIDGDDIPELYLSGDCEATGDSICSYKNGTVVEQQLNRIGGGWYIERSGNLINQNGNMGHKYTHVYKLGKDKFELTFKALLVEHNEVLEDDEYKLYYEYSIGDESVNETEYKAAVENAFDFENAVRLNDNSVEYDSIRQQITEFEYRKTTSS